MHLNAHGGVQSVLSVEARSLRVLKERHIKYASHVDFRGAYRSVKAEERQLMDNALVAQELPSWFSNSATRVVRASTLADSS